MSNPRSIIKGAIRALGRLGRGRDMTAEESTDGLELLNQLLGTIRGENLLLPFRTTEQFPYAPPSDSRTIGLISITDPVSVSVSVAHGASVGDKVVISGSNSTPSIDGTWLITTIPSSTVFTIPTTITGPGTAGTAEFAPSLTSKNEYTIGLGGDFHTERPIQVLGGFHRDSTGSDYPLKLMSFRRYNNIAYKPVGTYPERMYYEPEYPLGKIHFDFQPSTSLTLHLNSMKEITQFADLTTTINLPVEYDNYFRTNLAMMWAPDFGQTASQELVMSAVQSKDAIKRIARANREETLVIDSGLRTKSRYNINSDRYNN